MGEKSGREQDGTQGARSPRRASPVASVTMLLVAGVVWFFLHNLASLHVVLDLVIAAVVGLVVGFVVQEAAGRRRS